MALNVRGLLAGTRVPPPPATRLTRPVPVSILLVAHGSSPCIRASNTIFSRLGARNGSISRTASCESVRFARRRTRENREPFGFRILYFSGAPSVAPETIRFQNSSFRGLLVPVDVPTWPSFCLAPIGAESGPGTRDRLESRRTLCASGPGTRDRLDATRAIVPHSHDCAGLSAGDGAPISHDCAGDGGS